MAGYDERIDAGHDQNGDQLRWWVSCRDTAGRRRQLTVVLQNGMITVIAPPGEAATLTPAEATHFSRNLSDAAYLARIPSGGRGR